MEKHVCIFWINLNSCLLSLVVKIIMRDITLITRAYINSSINRPFSG